MRQTLALRAPLQASFRGGSKHSEIIAEVRVRVRVCLSLGAFSWESGPITATRF